MQLRSFSIKAWSVLAAGLLLTLGILVVPGHAAAQDTAMTPHPAHIHSGTCSALGDVVYPLTDVSTGGMMGTPMAGETMGTPATLETTPSPTADSMMTGTPMGSPTAMGTEMSVTTVKASLTDLAAGKYAINVHESAANIGNYIACGNIEGTANANKDLTVQLDTLNNSGYSGTAMLHDNGDGSTTVTIQLMHKDKM